MRTLVARAVGGGSRRRALLSSAPAGWTHVFCASDASSVGGWLPTITYPTIRLEGSRAASPHSRHPPNTTDSIAVRECERGGTCSPPDRKPTTSSKQHVANNAWRTTSAGGPPQHLSNGQQSRPRPPLIRPLTHPRGGGGRSSLRRSPARRRRASSSFLRARSHLVRTSWRKIFWVKTVILLGGSRANSSKKRNPPRKTFLGDFLRVKFVIFDPIMDDYRLVRRVTPFVII